MTTSLNTSWELTRNPLIYAAYRKIGYLAEGQTLSSEALTNGAEGLNGVVSLLATEGMPLWKRTSLVVPLTLGTTAYSLPSSLKLAQLVLETSGGSQYPLQEKSLYDFNSLPTGSFGIPVHYTYQPTIADGTVTIWPTPDSTTITQYSLVAVYQKKFDGFFNEGETLDFPSYWTQPIIYLLAQVLAPESGLPLQDRQLLAAEAKAYKDMANGYMDEDGSLYVQPDPMNRRW